MNSILRTKIGSKIISRLPNRIQRAVFAYQFDGTVESQWGSLIQVNPVNKFERHMALGTYELEEVNYFINIVSDEEYKKFADVGGYVGLYTLLFSHYTGNNADVFEPVPWNAARVKENLLVNDIDNVSVHEFAIDDSVSTETLVLTPELSIEASITETTFTGNNNRHLEVQTQTLDGFFDERELPDLTRLCTFMYNLQSRRNGGRDGLCLPLVH